MSRYIVLLILVFLSSYVHAAVLFNNGPVSEESYWCDQGPTGCGASNGVGFTYTDNFVLSTSALVSGFSYKDFFYQGSSSDYLSTRWSVWGGNPAQSGASLLYSGESIATISWTGNLADPLEFLVGHLNIDLVSGTYWLGIENWVANGAITTIAATTRNDGIAGDVAIEFDGNGYQTHPVWPDRAFAVYGTPTVPEPSSGLLASIALVCCLFHVRSRQRLSFHKDFQHG
jgi:hypothetical protein